MPWAWFTHAKNVRQTYVNPLTPSHSPGRIRVETDQMPRPPAELRKLEDEEKRRARAHQRLQWERRRHGIFLTAAVLAALGVLLLVARLTGLPLG